VSKSRLSDPSWCMTCIPYSTSVANRDRLICSINNRRRKAVAYLTPAISTARSCWRETGPYSLVFYMTHTVDDRFLSWADRFPHQAGNGLRWNLARTDAAARVPSSCTAVNSLLTRRPMLSLSQQVVTLNAS